MRKVSSHTPSAISPLAKGQPLVFVGEMASLSFLQFLRQIVKQYIGRSSFTETNNRMLEIHTGRHNLQPSETDSAEHKRALILCFYQGVRRLVFLGVPANRDPVECNTRSLYKGRSLLVFG